MKSPLYEPKPLMEIEYKMSILDPVKGLMEGSWNKCHSFTQQFLQIILATYAYADVANVKQITGTLSTINKTWSEMVRMGNAAAGNVGTGIVLGTDDTAEAVTDYHLIAKVAHGNAAGQLNYGANVFDAVVAVTGGEVTFEMARTFPNNSGGAIIIKEIGMDMLYSSISFLIVRDVVTPVTVNDGQSVKVTFKFKTTN